MDEGAFGAVAGKDIHAVLAALEGGRAIVKTKPTAGFFRAVAAQAGVLQDRLDVAGKINRPGGGWRHLGWINLGRRTGRAAPAKQEKQ